MGSPPFLLIPSLAGGFLNPPPYAGQMDSAQSVSSQSAPSATQCDNGGADPLPANTRAEPRRIQSEGAAQFDVLHVKSLTLAPTL